MIKVGIIGGSGLDDPNLLQDYREIEADTIYGKPSSNLTLGKIGNIDVVILARHGKKHSINPSNVNYRANIWALKEQGCTHILVSSACGSLREEIKPGDLVFIDQFIDRTTRRNSTFYDKDKVAHIPMAEPFCEKLRKILISEANKMKIRFHEKGTMVTIEGPRFSTKAESHLFRQWKADVINMTTIPEVVLAREAGLCYAAVAMSTDYDCWHSGEEAVSIEMVLNTMKKNADNVKLLLLNVIPRIDFEACSCKEHIKSAVI